MATKGRRKADADEQRGMEELASFAIHWIRLVAIILGAGVLYLELRNAPLDSFANTFNNSSLIKVGLVIFFFGWGWGAKDDTDIQRIGYRNDPRLGKIGPKEWCGIALFLVLFVTLFLIPDRPIWFQLTLLGLILVNSWTWRVIFDRTREVIVSSYQTYTASGDARSVIGLTKLLLVVEYMNGSWQRRRFRTLIILAALQVPVAMLVESGRLAGVGADIRVNGVSGEVLIGYLPGAFFILYVLISEIWMKIYRIRIFSDMRTIDWIAENFAIAKARGVPLPEPHLVRSFDFSPTTNENYIGRGGPLRWFTSAN